MLSLSLMQSNAAANGERDLDLTVRRNASRSRSTSLSKQSTPKFYEKMLLSVMANTFHGRIVEALLGDYWNSWKWSEAPRLISRR